MTQRGFQMAKVITASPVTTGVNSPINQLEVLAITYSLHAQKSCVQGVIGFCFASHWIEKLVKNF